MTCSSAGVGRPSRADDVSVTRCWTRWRVSGHIAWPRTPAGRVYGRPCRWAAAVAGPRSGSPRGSSRRGRRRYFPVPSPGVMVACRWIFPSFTPHSAAEGKGSSWCEVFFFTVARRVWRHAVVVRRLDVHGASARDGSEKGARRTKTRRPAARERGPEDARRPVDLCAAARGLAVKGAQLHRNRHCAQAVSACAGLKGQLRSSKNGQCRLPPSASPRGRQFACGGSHISGGAVFLDMVRRSVTTELSVQPTSRGERACHEYPHPHPRIR